MSTALKHPRVDFGVTFDVFNRDVMACSYRLDEIDQSVDLSILENLLTITVMHQFYADRADIVAQGVIGHSIFRCAGSNVSRAIDNVMNAKNRVSFEKILPTRGIARRPRIDDMAVNAKRAADRVDYDSVNFSA
jgi:hypothetical protein